VVHKKQPGAISAMAFIVTPVSPSVAFTSGALPFPSGILQPPLAGALAQPVAIRRSNLGASYPSIVWRANKPKVLHFALLPDWAQPDFLAANCTDANTCSSSGVRRCTNGLRKTQKSAG
jgi:hypothetical protein